MTTPEIVTCGDLAALGGPWDALWQHDPAAMVAGRDVLCHCWDGGRHAPPDTTDPVACEVPLVAPINDVTIIRVCCLCMPYFADATREVGRGLHRWLREQVAEALVYRDRRRLDSSPAPCDMDVEAAAMDRMEDER